MLRRRWRLMRVTSLDSRILADCNAIWTSYDVLNPIAMPLKAVADPPYDAPFTFTIGQFPLALPRAQLGGTSGSQCAVRNLHQCTERAAQRAAADVEEIRA